MFGFFHQARVSVSVHLCVLKTERINNDDDDNDDNDTVMIMIRDKQAVAKIRSCSACAVCAVAIISAGARQVRLNFRVCAAKQVAEFDFRYQSAVASIYSTARWSV